ncbi:hypothetical protein ACFQLX_16580 [Streptomyces polyrhachis]|uniref:Uncharacterized protein n=1 Tax=Streptomyces polyrhachis TaxID=1282885 RepID=A0ABW2GJ46_9ACTN
MVWQAPLVVHPPSPGGGRRVSVRGEDVGLAHDDGELVGLLRAAGFGDADIALDDPHLVEWRGGAPHQWAA